MSKKLKLNCGCEFEAECNENGDIISLNYDPENVRMDCIKTWNLLAEGNTLGTFQLHTKLGQSLASKVQPYCIEELSDLISIMRPGCMDAIIGDKSLTEHYIERKHGREKVEPIHPALGESTKDTQGIMCYQEQVILAAKTLAGFDSVQGRKLQKAMTKKKPELMAKIKQQFVDGCKERGIVNETEAQEVFDVIEANQRYSFCKAHAYGYAVNNYLYSAYPKAHFPRTFYIAQMEFAKDIQEIGAFVKDAQKMGISVRKPDIRKLNPNFCIINNDIYFGLKAIKGIGEGINQMLEQLQTYKFTTWHNFLFEFYESVNSKIMDGLISSGALDFFGVARNSMLYDITILDRMNTQQLAFCRASGKSLKDNIDDIINLGTGKFCPCKTKATMEKLLTTKNMLENPPFSLQDTLFDLEKMEKEYLGAAFSANEIDGSIFNELVNDTCQTVKESMEAFKSGEKHKSKFRFIAKIIRVKAIKTKNGEEMAFLEFGDSDAIIDGATCFPGVFQKYKGYLYENNKLLITGSLTKARGYGVGFSVDSISQI